MSEDRTSRPPGVPQDGSLGVYVHVPFCERICPYCDFAVVLARRLDPEREGTYVAALLAELAGRTGDFAGLALASLYLGGGTPSLLRPDSVLRIVEAVRGAFPSPGELEVTLEVNPSSTERGRLAGFRDAGVRRLSIGVQSFDDTVLRRLGRAHRAGECHATLAAAREAGFENVSLDLIFGVPDQTLAMLEDDLAQAAAFGPEHVSAYGLTVEPGTPYETGVARGQLVLPEEALAAHMWETVQERLPGAGLQGYELSSFARPGFEAVHNRRYWERRPVLGLGMGAWSVDPVSEGAPHGSRRANVRDLPTYLARAARAGSAAGPAGPPEVLEAATARGEAVFLALRARWGLAPGPFAREFGAPPRAFFAPVIDEFVAAGLLEEDPDGTLRLSSRGRRLSDSVFERFV